MTKYDPARAVIAHPSFSAPCSATKSSTTSAPAPPVSSCTAATCPPSATTVWCAELLGELERLGVLVHDDDPGRGERGQALDADVAEPARAHEHAGGAGGQQRDGLAHRVVGGDPGVGQRSDVLRLGLRVELHAGARRGAQEPGHPAVAGQAGELAAD